MTDPTGTPPDPRPSPPAPRGEAFDPDPWGHDFRTIDDAVSLTNVRFADVAVVEVAFGDLPDGYAPATGPNATIVDDAHALELTVVRDPFGDLTDELVPLVRFEIARQLVHPTGAGVTRWFVLVGPAGVVVAADGRAIDYDPRYRVYLHPTDLLDRVHDDLSEMTKRLSSLAAMFEFLKAAGWSSTGSHREIVLIDHRFIPRTVPESESGS